MFISEKSVALETLTGDANSGALSSYHVGATTDGVEVAYEPDYTDIEVDQLKDAALIYHNGFSVTVRTNLAEATLNNLKVAWGLLDADLDTDVNTETLNIPIPGDEPHERKLLILGRNTEDLTRKYFARRAVAVDTSSHALRRGEATVFPVAFRLLADPGYTGSEYGWIEDALT